MSHGKRVTLLLILSSLLLTGAKCTVKASSGSGSSQHREAEVSASSGRFSGCSERCLAFSTGGGKKYTGRDGEFSFSSGARIRFFLGDVQLGEEVEAKDAMTPVELFQDGSLESRAVINLTRLLISLDSTPADPAISIPRKVHETVVHANADVAHSIDSMNFGNEAEFLNAASQILAVSAPAYLFTPTLADPETARRWLAERL